jgi:RecA-family ATPase
MGVEQQLPVCKAKDLMVRSIQQAWLIESLWGDAAVGIIGGAPKCCKSWLGLDMAVSVASKTPCLGRFQVPEQGKVLIFLAEDAAHNVRARIESICTHRSLDIDELDLYVITADTMRLDLEADQQMLTKTLDSLRPKLLILDPLVRLHRLDENSASDISRLLGFLRGLQRKFATAIVLVHHASKKHRSQPGQALRGSSDLHAFGDSNAYLARKRTIWCSPWNIVQQNRQNQWNCSCFQILRAVKLILNSPLVPGVENIL